MSGALGDHFFRHEYGRLVAVLARRVGAHHLEAVEDAVQAALLAAVEAWPRGALPDDPPAWLYRVAHNQLIGELRTAARRGALAAAHARAEPAPDEAPPVAHLATDVADDLLRWLFVCCDDALPVEAQLVLALRTLCGFGVREIGERLFLSEANVYKRLGRARARLRALPFPPDELTGEQLAARLGAVHAILYALFAEGHLSSHADGAIRRELCDEAVRLAQVLAGHPLGATPTTFALLALMHLHRARLAARQDERGDLLLLDEQDRSRWDQADVGRGLWWLARAASGDELSRYHAEAGIAAEHCLAPSLAATRWERVVLGYELLERAAPSPLHALNRAVAMAEWRGPAHGLAVLAERAPPPWLAGSWQWAAVAADLHRRNGDVELARAYREEALAAAPSAAVRAALERRLR